MSPKDKLIAKLHQVSELAIRAELSLHGLKPSEFISKEILMNMLVTVYFGDG
ncbi:hypothetical protein [Peribacillus loiseleuriae]|uniref:hypothetical protein n=1 Tax=Peribacillus loiseleuriae TaxID=1679170 RepID=UPI000A9CF156|nr:hypothetical protein [Peribacillus loiseleuriae]